MTTKFEIKTWMTENRETILTSYSNLKNEQFFNQITLKDFMVKIFNLMLINNPKSEKRAASLLPTILGQVYFNNSKLG